jgi:hypothetical protein
MALYLATTILACAAAIFTTSMLSDQPDSMGSELTLVEVLR